MGGVRARCGDLPLQAIRAYCTFVLLLVRVFERIINYLLLLVALVVIPLLLLLLTAAPPVIALLPPLLRLATA